MIIAIILMLAGAVAHYQEAVEVQKIGEPYYCADWTNCA